ncbi:hypothetical protein IW261DRAFT_1570776 [Armillaria novae-zelandiae]|uniref:Uncharacterized protein n=1 Tax=Armillaria novae-zelandiae TaxID=153914 RepID=A0AA39TXE0_9AGAR|nr:hypothetical protein IW261DRAFT_1570776 [Armillaria novae-zelandiae]
MTEATRNIEFTAATGFGHDEEEHLAKNAISFQMFKTGDFAAFSDIWLDTIWQQHILYWPPTDRSDTGLRTHRKRVQHALRWLFNTMDPDTRQQELAYAVSHEPKVHPPRKSVHQHPTVQPTISQVPPRIDIIKPPTPKEIAKSKAVHAAKYAVRICLRRWKDAEEGHARCLACSEHIQTLDKLCQQN